MWIEFIWIATIAIPYVYILSRAASSAWYASKIEYHHKLMKHLEQ